MKWFSSRNILRLVVVCAVSALAPLVGCVRIPVFVPVGIEQDTSRSQSLCQSIVGASTVSARNFRSLLETKLEVSRDESYSFRYAIVGRAPGDLRVDVLPTEGAFTLGLLVAQGQDVLLIDSQTKRYSKGCRSNDLFKRFFGLEGVTPDVVRALILGHVPVLQCEKVTAYRGERDSLLLVDSSSRYVWEVEESSSKVRSVELLDSSMQRVYLRALRGYAPELGSIHIEIFSPANATADMVVRKLVYDPKLMTDPFSVQIPVGYSKEDC